MKTALSQLISSINHIADFEPYGGIVSRRVGKKFFGKFNHSVTFKTNRDFSENSVDKNRCDAMFGFSEYARGFNILDIIANAWKKDNGKDSIRTRCEHYYSYSVFFKTVENADEFIKITNLVNEKFEVSPFRLTHRRFYDGPDDLHASRVVCYDLPYGKYRIKATLDLYKIDKDNTARLVEILEKGNASGDYKTTQNTINRIRRGPFMYGKRILNMLDRKTLFTFTMVAGSECITKVEEYIKHNELETIKEI